MKKLPLSPKEEKVYAYVLGYLSDYAYAPTRREIGEELGMTIQQADRCVRGIMMKGKFKLNRNKWRNIVDPKLIINK